MALDWSKQISFSGLRKRAPKAKAAIPTKTYINLMPQKESTNDPRKVVPLAVVLVLVVGIFAKFGVFDFYDRVNQRQAELTQQTQIHNAIKAQLVDYDEVKAEYDAYESAMITSGDDQVSASEAMTLVDRYIAAKASIGSMEYQDNTLTVDLVGTSLDVVGQLVSTLYELDNVANVSVSTAGTETSGADAGSVTAALVITLQKV